VIITTWWDFPPGRSTIG